MGFAYGFALCGKSESCAIPDQYAMSDDVAVTLLCKLINRVVNNEGEK